MNKNIKSTKGFTLVEMLGVLAIIAILVSIVSVGVMTAIKNARITGTVANLKNYETALAAHITLNEGNGFVPLTKGMSATQLGNVGDEKYVHLGQVLLSSGALENLPTWRVGREGKSTTMVISAKWDADAAVFDKNGGTPGTDMIDWSDRIRAEAALASDPADAITANSAIITADCKNAQFVIPNMVPEGAIICYIKMPKVALTEAIKLSEALNRGQNTATALTKKQEVGRFVFGGAVSTVADGVVDCYYYLGNF